MKTCETLKEKILAKGAQYLECSREEVDFDGKKVFCLKDGREISLMEIGNRIMCNNEDALFASESYSSPVSPPPFMVGMAEVDVDQETGEIELVDYVAVVDCGTVVNPSLARVQTEAESRRESEWLSMKMLYTVRVERISAILLCSIRFRADRM